MMSDPLKFKKGFMGYLLDMRKAMGEAGGISRHWCRAFDVVDNLAMPSTYPQAMVDMGDDFARAMKEFGEAAAMVVGLNDREAGG